MGLYFYLMLQFCYFFLFANDVGEFDFIGIDIFSFHRLCGMGNERTFGIIGPKYSGISGDGLIYLIDFSHLNLPIQCYFVRCGNFQQYDVANYVRVDAVDLQHADSRGGVD